MNDDVDVDVEKWLSVADPTPRLGWYKNHQTGRINFSKSPRQPKRKFGSTNPRPQKIQWRREDDRAYYEAMYGFTSCWFCRECSCCCKCHGEPEWTTTTMYISDEEADTEGTQADQTQQAQTQQTQEQETDGRSSADTAVADADKIQQSPRKTKPIVPYIERNTR